MKLCLRKARDADPVSVPQLSSWAVESRLSRVGGTKLGSPTGLPNGRIFINQGCGLPVAGRQIADLPTGRPTAGNLLPADNQRETSVVD